jgi:Xaa-Pro aminopeptidase
METMQPVLKNGRNVYDMINMPEEEFEARLVRVRAAMVERDIDLLLVYTSGLTDYGDVTYLTNFVIRLPRGQLVAFPKEGEPVTFFEGASRGLPSLKMTLALGDLVAVNDLPKECAKYLKEKGWIPGKVGFAGLRTRMPYQQFRALSSGLQGSTIKDANDILADCRAIKSPREVDQIKRAASIVGKLTLLLKETTFERPSERAVEAALYRAARFEGAEDLRMLLAKPGREMVTFRPTSNEALKEDGEVVVYLAVEFERYWAEAIRTFTYSAGSFVEEKSVESSAAFARFCKALKPGAKVSEFYQQASALSGSYCVDILRPYGFGNGIGLGLDEAPFLREESVEELKQGMVVSLRTATPGSNGASCSLIGNTFLVDGHGGSILTIERERPIE